jgi:hypothetical protein
VRLHALQVGAEEDVGCKLADGTRDFVPKIGSVSEDGVGREGPDCAAMSGRGASRGGQKGLSKQALGHTERIED